MERTAPSKVIDLTPHLAEVRRSRRRDRIYTLCALWTQYLSLAALLLYGLLRLTVCRDAAPGCYSGPLALLWPLSFALLLTSYLSDLLLWREE